MPLTRDQFSSLKQSTMKNERLYPILLSVSVIAIALIVYIPTMAHSITWQHGGADSGELAAAVVTNGVAHPPGYPTYLLLGSFWLMLPLAKDPAYQLNLLSVVSTALAGGFTAYTIMLLSGSRLEQRHYLGAFFGSLSLLFAPLVWSQALITEVYALGLLMVSAVTHFLLVWYQKTALVPIDNEKQTSNASREGSFDITPPSTLSRDVLYNMSPEPVEGGVTRSGMIKDSFLSSASFYLYSASLLFGLGLGVLPQLVLILPGAMWVYLSQVRERGVKQLFWQVCSAGLAVALGLSTYFLLPWRAAMQPRANWGNPVTLESFWQLVTASQYHHLAEPLVFETWLNRLGESLILVDQNFKLFVLPLSLLAIRFLWRHNRIVLGYLISLIVLTLFFRTSYSAIGNQVYLIPALYGLNILVGLSIGPLFELIPAGNKRFVHLFSFCFIVIPLLVGVTMMRQMDISHEYGALLFGQRTFNTLPHDAIVVTERDEYTFSLWYYQSLGQRLDVVVIDSRLLSYEWYRAHLIHHYPDLNPAAVRLGGLTALERPLYQLITRFDKDELIKIK